MRTGRFCLAFTILLAITGLFLITAPPADAFMGDITNVIVKDDTLHLSLGHDKLVVEVCKQNLIKIDYQPGGKTSPDTLILDPHKTWSMMAAKIDASDDPILITTGRMKVEIYRKPCRIAVYDRAGKLLIEEVGSMKDLASVTYGHGKGDNFYGIGSYFNKENTSPGILRNKGWRVHAGEQGDAGAPFVWSTKGYGLLIDADSGDFKINDNHITYTFDPAKKKTNLKYFIMTGKPMDIMSTLADVSGRPPMFPKWAMGFGNTEWDIDQAEMESLVKTYREKQIPIDVFILDFDWKAWGDDNYGESRWNVKKFPDGPSGKLRDDMLKKGIKMTGIMKPRILVESEQGRYATEHGFWWDKDHPYRDYFKRTLVNDLNFSIPACREWYFDHMKQAFDTGIIGWWNDEADEACIDFDNDKHRFFDVWEFMNMQRALYEGQRKYTKDKVRVWSINRNFYLGAQRYAYGHWSGDCLTGFRAMAVEPIKMLTAVNLGSVKWSMDTGGWAGHPSDENYKRWMQFAAFVPIYRVHGMEKEQRQPWCYGPDAEKATTTAIRFRYSMIPYLYAYERLACETGVGLVRPLLYYYPNDPEVANYSHAWMFGDWMLVSPILTEKTHVQKVYLPKGRWIDFFRGKEYAGGQYVNYTTDETAWVPLFIKKGAIIPTQDVQNWVGEAPVTLVYLDIFPDIVKTHFTYYDDDGETYDYEKNGFFKQYITTVGNDATTSLTLSKSKGEFKPALQFFLCRVYRDKAQEVTDNNVSLKQYDSYEALKNAPGEGWAIGTERNRSVVYVKLQPAVETSVTIK